MEQHRNITKIDLCIVFTPVLHRKAANFSNIQFILSFCLKKEKKTIFFRKINFFDCCLLKLIVIKPYTFYKIAS